MKTTVEISDALFNEAKKLAAREDTTVRMLIEQGLRQVISQRRQKRAFRLRKATYKGQGLNAELQPDNWERLRELAYEGHGS